MRTVLIFVHHATGHVNATLKIAKILTRYGYKVVYASFKSNQKLFERHNITFYGLETTPFATNSERLFTDSNGRMSYLDNLMLRLIGQVYTHREEELSRIILETEPDCIMIDPFLSTDFVVLYPLCKRRNIPMVFIQTMLSTYRMDGVPPIYSSLIPKGTWASRLSINAAWHKFHFLTGMQRLIERVIYLGRDDLSLVKNKIRLNKIPASYSVDLDKVYHLGFKNVPELVVAPKELEFNPAMQKPGQYYVGSQIDLDRINDTIDQRYDDVIADINLKRRQNPNCKLIYCSFGSRFQYHEKLIAAFILRLTCVARSNPNYYFVVSSSKPVELSVQNGLPNFYILNGVPQLDILSSSDLFITHGGLNSVKESLHFGVPMLVYFLEEHGDQNGNASKVQFHGLGLRGNIAIEKENDIALKINEVLNNPAYLARMRKFTAELSKYTEEYFLTTFEAILNKSNVEVY